MRKWETGQKKCEKAHCEWEKHDEMHVKFHFGFENERMKKASFRLSHTFTETDVNFTYHPRFPWNCVAFWPIFVSRFQFRFVVFNSLRKSAFFFHTLLHSFPFYSCHSREKSLLLFLSYSESHHTDDASAELFTSEICFLFCRRGNSIEFSSLDKLCIALHLRWHLNLFSRCSLCTFFSHNMLA